MLAECTLMCSWTGPVDMVRREGGVRRAPPSFCPSSRNGIVLVGPARGLYGGSGSVSTVAGPK